MPLTTYPDSFPAAQVMPYTATADMGVLRTSMEGGNARQRRRYYTMPHTFALEFIMDVPTLGNWQAWINANAYDFFEMPLLESMWSTAGQVASLHSIRFTSNLTISNVMYGFVRVQVSAELDPRQAAYAGPPLPIYNWLIGGEAPAPSSPDKATAGTPSTAAVPQIAAGTPRLPATLVPGTSAADD